MLHNRGSRCTDNSHIRGGISRKTDEIAAVLSSNSIDMAFFTESWATDEMNSGLFNIDGYVCHRRDRNDGRRGGGLLAYVRSDMPCTRIPSLEHPDLETMWLLYRQPQMPRFVSHILFGCIYHPPDKNNWELSAHILQCLDEVVRKHPNAKIILLGDFNQLPDSSITSYPLKQVVRSPTRKKAILDKIFMNIAEWYDHPIVIPSIGLSDHDSVLMKPSFKYSPPHGRDVMVTLQSRDHNGKHSLQLH